MTLQELAEEVLSPPDSDNIVAISRSFAKAMYELRQHCKTSTEVDTHPITNIWMEKLKRLNRYESLCHEDYRDVQKMIDNTD